MQWWNEPSVLDRVEQSRRDDSWLADTWSEPGSRLIVVDEAGLLEIDAHGRLAVTRPSGAFDPQRHWLLGMVGPSAVFTTIGEVPAGRGLRDLAPEAGPVDAQLAAAALALTGWHRLSPRCALCGGGSRVDAGGLVLTCLGCGRERFPRSDPAVIVAVVDAHDRLLLGRHASWPATRMSLLAGFVSAGESLEQAVHREVAEEVGVELAAVRYLASQPWPMPRSLMVAFVASAATTQIRVDEVEIETARWFSRRDIDAELRSGGLSLPPRASIARSVIEGWRAASLPPVA